jgi:hypothetical protein
MKVLGCIKIKQFICAVGVRWSMFDCVTGVTVE